jgi:hypothetical protein
VAGKNVIFGSKKPKSDRLLVAIGNSKPSDDSWFVGNYERKTGDHGVEKEVCSILKSAGSTERIPF